MFTFQPTQLDQYAPYATFDGVFTVLECQKIQAAFSFKDAKMASVVGNEGRPTLDESVRRSSVNWLGHDPGNKWIYDRISDVALGCNAVRWRFQLSGFHEPIQFGHYMQGGFYNWHQDHGNGEFSKRKLSVVVQLSDPDDYSGGHLEFYSGERAISAQGSMIIFPSYQVHRVTPIMSGGRYSFAAWISGDSYR